MTNTYQIRKYNRLTGTVFVPICTSAWWRHGNYILPNGELHTIPVEYDSLELAKEAIEKHKEMILIRDGEVDYTE